MTTSQTAPPPTGNTALGASLRRTTDDRLLLGVCGGIARAVGASPVAIRLATVVLACVLLPLVAAAYAALALIVPRNDGSALVGNGTRDGRDIFVVLLYLTIAAPLVLGTAGSSFFGGFAAWPGIAAAAVAVLVLAIWRPKALFGERGDGHVASAATAGAAAGAPTVSPAFGDPFAGTVTGPYPDAEPRPEPVTETTQAGPSFVKADPSDDATLTHAAVPPSEPAPAPRIRRRSIALPILAVLALVPALFVVGVALGIADDAWNAWSVMLAVMAVGAAAGAVAVAVLRPSYLGAGFLVILAAILGAGSIGLNQLGPVFDDGFGESTFVPATAAEIPSQYVLGVGHLNVDLRQLPLRPGSTTTVHAKIGFGQMRIVVPRGVRVVAAPGSQVPNLISTAQRNGATAKTSARAPVIALDLQARGAELDLLGGEAKHYENMTVLSSQATGFWGTTNETASRTALPAVIRP